MLPEEGLKKCTFLFKVTSTFLKRCGVFTLKSSFVWVISISQFMAMSYRQLRVLLMPIMDQDIVAV